ncbi:ceramide phosphoethanolamine synthase-like isoform X1 [Mytilus edulis]|uniref:ceramide phosphoethanolamine synthase-like isoform X1 n=1 Tax=Mytilus edulis TaxID=6550 RepID=UPI0039F0118F
MMTLIPQVLRNERNLCCLFFLLLFSYYITMDVILYVTIQDTTFTDQTRGESYSMFHPLSAKLVMSDHTNHYFMVPTTEIFDELTRFSKVFFFVTPNMVTITHFILALVASKFVSSENLKHRRIAVVIYEFRIWLDSLDGVIYRSHAHETVYKSNKSTLGYYMDTTLDVLGGVAFNLGVVFFLFKGAPLISKTQEYILPFCKPAVPTENGVTNGNGEKYTKPSKKFIFWKCWCFGFQIFMASGSWDKRTEQMGEALETNLKNDAQTTLQTSMLHSFSTWLVMYIYVLYFPDFTDIYVTLLQYMVSYVYICFIFSRLYRHLCYTPSVHG